MKSAPRSWSDELHHPGADHESTEVLSSGSKKAQDVVVSDPVNLLMAQIREKSILTPQQEVKISRTLLSARQKCLEELFTYVPAASRALELVEITLKDKAHYNIENILHVASNEPKQDVAASLAKAALNAATARTILNRIQSNWASRASLHEPMDSQRSQLKAIEANKQKLGLLLAEIPMRPAFIDNFLRQFREHAEPVEKAVRLSKKLRAAIDAGLETRASLLAKLQRLVPAYAEYSEAKRTLVLHNLRLVVNRAKRFTGGTLSREDLVQEGIICLMNAADKFDPERGLRFSTYATRWIDQGFYRHAENQGRTVRVPAAAQGTMRQIEKYRQSARIELGREPTLQEIELAFKHIKTQLKVKASWLAQAQAGSRPEISLSAQREHRSDTSTAGAELLVDKALPPEEQVLAEMTQESLVNDIRRALRETLEERELQIIEARFGFNGLPVKTLNELGTEFEITKEGIRQVQLKALAKLKASSLLKRYQDL